MQFEPVRFSNSRGVEVPDEEFSCFFPDKQHHRKWNARGSI